MSAPGVPTYPQTYPQAAAGGNLRGCQEVIHRPAVVHRSSCPQADAPVAPRCFHRGAGAEGQAGTTRPAPSSTYPADRRSE